MSQRMILQILIKASNHPDGKLISAPHRQAMIGAGWVRQERGSFYITDAGRLIAADYEAFKAAGAAKGTGKGWDEYRAEREARRAQQQRDEDGFPPELDIDPATIARIDTIENVYGDVVTDATTIGITPDGIPVVIIEDVRDEDGNSRGPDGTPYTDLKVMTIWAYPSIEAARKDRLEVHSETDVIPLEAETVPVEQARAKLGDLVLRAMNGEATILTRYGNPVAKIAPFVEPKSSRTTRSMKKPRTPEGDPWTLR